MNGFELDMKEPGPNKRRQVVVFRVQVFFEVGKQFGEPMGRRRHKGGIARTGSANPVLAAPDFTGELAGSPRPLQKTGVGVVQEAHGKRKARPRSGVARGRIQARRGSCRPSRMSAFSGRGGFRPVGLKVQEINQGRLRALDLRGQDRFLADKSVDEPVEGGHHLTSQFQSTERFIRRPKLLPDRITELEHGTGWRQGMRDKCRHFLPGNRGGFVGAGDALGAHCERNLARKPIKVKISFLAGVRCEGNL